MNLRHAKHQIREVGQADFEVAVLHATRPVLVAFCAPWSRPCHILDATLNDVAAACAATTDVVRVNADDNPELSLWYDVQSIPAILFFVSGSVCAKLIGTASKEAILAKLYSVLGGSPGAPASNDLQT